MTRLSVEDAHALVARAHEASNVSQANARAVADALIGAELVGQGGHGLRRVAAYTAQARAGKVKGHAVPRAERPRPGAVWVDAGHGFAYPAFALAIEELARIAPEQGIAVAGVRRSHHAGVLGLFVEALAERGLVALMVANAPAAIAPWGGRRPTFGTNPIAFACPVPGALPIVADVSTSQVARGKLMAAAQKGETIPEGWALDADGNPTTDPKAGMAGTMAPLGGATGGAKGVALALMVEVLAGPMIAGGLSRDASSFFDDAGGPPDVGQTIIAIDPAAYGGTAALDRFAALSALFEGDGEARLPGARRAALRAQRQASGLDVDDDLFAAIDAIARGAVTL